MSKTVAVSRRLASPYIQKYFPVELLTPIVTSEVNSKKPIYQMHKWWARRLSSVFRMLLVSSFSDEHETRKEIWKKYSGGFSLNGRIVLDAMMGGGTSIVEALKLGAKVIGVDINPVAWFVTKKEVEHLDIEQVRSTFQILEREAGRKIKQYYATKCPNGHDAEIMYEIWHKRVNCANCRKPINILQEYVISERTIPETKTSGERTELVMVCPSCFSIFTRRHDIKTLATCPDCGNMFKPRKATSENGTITCQNPACGFEEGVTEAVRRIGGPLEIVPFCIEYYCPSCNRRGYKKPESDDLQRYERTKEEFERVRSKLLYPREPIPDSPRDHRPKSHGYNYYYELFTERQLLSMSLLLEGIIKIEDKNVREFLLLAFSSCLETNNILCKYETKWQKSSAMFSLPGYHPVDRIAENNVWGTRYGRGTFVKCFEKMMRGKRQLDETGGDQQTLDAKGSFYTNLAESFSELKDTERNAMLKCHNAESLRFIPDNSIDLVATDPPYFDNLNYSMLADFFYVWLRIALSNEYESFKPKSSAREGEVVMDGSKEKTTSQLVEGLTRIFSECERVLKPNRLMVFTFHHTQDWAWKGLLAAINNGGFSVVASHFVRSEGRTGFRKSGHISYDVCVVCRKADEIMIEENRRLASGHSKMWVNRLFQSGNGLQDSDVHSIVMGNLLTYTPKLVLNGIEKDNWVKNVMTECILLKNKLEERRTKRKASKATHDNKSVQSKLIV